MDDDCVLLRLADPSDERPFYCRANDTSSLALLLLSLQIVSMLDNVSFFVV